MEKQHDISRSFSSDELKGLWEFANAQYLLIKEKHANSDNHVEILCLAFAGNCIVDIMDEIAEMLEPSTIDQGTNKEPDHVCGAQGFNQMLGDICDACEKERPIKK